MILYELQAVAVGPGLLPVEPTQQHAAPQAQAQLVEQLEDLVSPVQPEDTKDKEVQC